MPVTATQIWQCLIIDSSPHDVRWGGHAYYSFQEITATLHTSEWLKEHLDAQWGYYTLSGKIDLVSERLQRHAIAQEKWKLTVRVARFLALVPFVRGLAGSGSLAIDNTKPTSDLDLLVISRRNRIWTARLGLLIVTQFLGRRRKYWNEQAPDMVCLNHYITDGSLTMPHDIQNLYTAVQYTSLVPVFNPEVVQQFQQANGAWIRQYVMAMNDMPLVHRNTVRLSSAGRWIKQLVEGLLLEPIGDGIEKIAEKIQRSFIQRHQGVGRAGRIAVSNSELAFHPDTKVPSILQQFHQDPGQRTLF